MPESIAQALSAGLRERGLAICLSGIDGSGKTTLALQLVGRLTAAGLPARYLHLYQWYVNLLAVPLLLLYNRYFDRKVLIFDRSFFDNIAVAALSPRCPRWLPVGILRVALAFYPRFDYRFYLFADYDETLRRRPDTSEQRYAAMTSAYGWITSRARHIPLRSDAMLFDRVLRIVAGSGNDCGSFSMESR